MKDQLLTIGNIIKTPKGVAVVHELYKDDLAIATDDFGIDIFGYEEVEGVPITDEWLEKLGFEKHVSEKGVYVKQQLDTYAPDAPSSNPKTNYSVYLKETINSCRYELSLSAFIFSIKECPVWKIHELQNHFAVMTGEKLEIEL